MPTILKCPNPTCSFQFDAALVPPGATIGCPLCRSQFTLGEPTAAAPPPAAAPLAEPTGDEPPRKKRVIDRHAGERPKGSNASLLFAVLIVGAVALLAGGGAFVAYLAGAFQKADKGTAADAAKFDDYGITLPKPPDGWVKDEPTRASFKVNLIAYRRTDPDGWVAVEAKKFDSAARLGELRLKVNERLRDGFTEVDEDVKGEEEKFQGHPGERFAFRGVYKPTGAGCKGEVRAWVVKSVAYWVWTWSPEAAFDQNADAVGQFRDGIKLTAGGGKGPTNTTKRPEKSFRTKSGLFTLTDTEGLWAEQPDPTRQDEAAELWLKGRGKSAATGAATTEKADLVVAVLAPDGEAKAQAQAHILKQMIDGATVDELLGDPTGDAPAGGEVPVTDGVWRIRLKYADGPTANKLIAFAAVDSGGKRVVAYASCSLPEATYWEQRMMLMVGTLKGK